MQQRGKGHNQERPCPRPHQAVIAANSQSNRQTHQRFIGTAEGFLHFSLLTEVLLYRQEHGDQRQSHQHQTLEQPVGHPRRKARANGSSNDCARTGAQSNQHPYFSAAEETNGRYGRAGTCYHLIRPRGQMHRHSGHHIGR